MMEIPQKTLLNNSNNQMDVVAVIDTETSGLYLEDRKLALEEIKQAVLSVGANFQRVQVIIYYFSLKMYNIFQAYYKYSLRNWILGKPMFWKLFIMPMLL